MGYKKFIVGFDSHGDQIDEDASEAFFSFIKEFKPHIRIAGGDQFDFRAIRKGADAEERRDSMRNDVQAGKEFLAQLKPNYYLRGNHCERLWELAEKDSGLESDYAKQGVADIEKLCAKMRTEILPYHHTKGVLKLGHLKVIHGFHCGVGAARRAAQIFGSTLMGHSHSIQHSSIEGLEPRMGRICGCLCKLDMGYNVRQPGTLAWAHGWPFGLLHDDGSYQVFQAEKCGGKWLLPTGFKEI